MKFCAHCGHAVERTVPSGDNRPRVTCPACSSIFYENPRVVVGCIVEEGDQLLLCRRAIEPRRGFWTSPGGFLELDESVMEGAARETWEEACAKVEILGLHSTFDLVHIGQIYMYFRARLVGGSFGVGEESLETALFSPEDIPWDELAFPVLRFSLELWSDDRESGRWKTHLGVVQHRGGAARYEMDGYELRDHFAHEWAGDPTRTRVR